LDRYFDTLAENFTPEHWPETKAACDAIDDEVRQAWVERFKKNEPAR
jgi:hypothetical protein